MSLEAFCLSLVANRIRILGFFMYCRKSGAPFAALGICRPRCPLGDSASDYRVAVDAGVQFVGRDARGDGDTCSRKRGPTLAR